MRFRLPDPATLTPAERTEHRRRVLGKRYNQYGTELPDGSAYYLTDDGPGRYLIHGFLGHTLRPSFCESYRTIEGRQARIERFRARCAKRRRPSRRAPDSRQP